MSMVAFPPRRRRGAAHRRLTAVENRLVWIMGSPRTGSTWLLRMLVHPWTLERTPMGLNPPGPGLPPPNVMPLNESFLPVHLAPQRGLRDLPDGWTPHSLTLNAQRAHDPGYFFSDARTRWWRDQLRQMILGSIDAQLHEFTAAYGGRGPWAVIKEPNGSHAAEMLFSLLPQAHLIFLLRDGRDVVDSIVDATLPGGWRSRRLGVTSPATAEQRLELVRTTATQWVINITAVQRAFAERPANLRIRLRYEDLRQDPVAELSRIATWLPLDWSDQRIALSAEALRFESLPAEQRGPGKAARLARPGAWRENLQPEEQRLAEEIMGPKLTELGYTVE